MLSPSLPVRGGGVSDVYGEPERGRRTPPLRVRDAPEEGGRSRSVLKTDPVFLFSSGRAAANEPAMKMRRARRRRRHIPG